MIAAGEAAPVIAAGAVAPRRTAGVPVRNVLGRRDQLEQLGAVHERPLPRSAQHRLAGPFSSYFAIWSRLFGLLPPRQAHPARPPGAGERPAPLPRRAPLQGGRGVDPPPAAQPGVPT